MSHSVSSLKFNRRLLLSNLISGAVCLFLALPWSGPLLFLIGATYVVAGSVFLGAVYAHEGLTIKQEVFTWIAPWFVAAALWAGLAIAMEFESSVSQYLFGLFAGLTIATPCYLVWQILALVVRQFMAWRSGEQMHVAESSD